MDKPPFSFRKLITLKNLILFVSVMIAVLLSLLIGYYIGFTQVQEKLDQEREETQRLMAQIENITKVEANVTKAVRTPDKRDLETVKLKKELKELLDHEALSARHEFAPKDKKALPPPPETKVFLLLLIKDKSLPPPA